MLKTAESVTAGHPDKVCDQISDAILDECLRQDQNTRAGIEVCGGHGQMFITGEVTTLANFDAAKIAQDIYHEIGYEETLDIKVNIVKQSPDIARGVDIGGAGDQGIMVGYATSETEELLPREHVLAYRLRQRLEEVRAKGEGAFGKFLRPDGKTQITLNNGDVEAVVLSAQHAENIDFDAFKQFIIDEVVKKIIPEFKNIYINPAGPWTIGGFTADAGLTGRKIIVDNYGPQVPVGGGCYSGKDPSKVDRSAAYMARHLAIEYLKKENAKEVLVKLAYAIGKAEPVMATALIDGRPVNIEGYDLTPDGIIKYLDLKKPKYREFARHGYFVNFI